MAEHTPQPVIDAIHVVAAHLRVSGYGGAIISPNGGTSFRIQCPVAREAELLQRIADLSREGQIRITPQMAKRALEALNASAKRRESDNVTRPEAERTNPYRDVWNELNEVARSSV